MSRSLTLALAVLVALLGTALYRAATPVVAQSKRPISWWPGEGDGRDIVGGHHLTLVAGTTFAPGKIGQGLSFDGIDDRAVIADTDDLKLTGSLTISAWLLVRARPQVAWGQIFFRGDNRAGRDPYQLAMTSSGMLNFHIETEARVETNLETPMPLGEFVHVVATLDDRTGEMRLYKNGVLAALTTTSIRPLRDLDPGSDPGIGIGNHPGTVYQMPFNGIIDELQVYNQALTADEIRNLYVTGATDPGLTLTVNPKAVAGGASSTATVTLGNPAPSGGTVVTLTSANPAVAAVPASVTIPAGSSSTLFSVTTVRVTAATQVVLSASTNGTTATAALTVWPDVTSLLINPATVAGGSPATGTIVLRGPAPDGGLAVLLASDNTAAATVPVSIVVPAGATTVSFPVTTRPVASATTVTISASYGGAAWTATLQVTPPSLVSLTLNPGSLMGGATATGTVTLSGPAPASGAAVTLSSGTPSVAAVPATVTVPASATTATFSITVQPVPATTAVLLSATYAGVTQSATLTVAPPFLTAISLNPSIVTGGIAARGTVTVTGIAPAGGAVVTLSSDNPAAAAVPASVTIPAGATTASFTVTTQAVTGVPTVTVSASYAGMTRTGMLTVLPVGLTAITLQPASVTGGFPSTATITLSGPAPVGGVVVSLSSDKPGVATLPASITVPAGSATSTASVTTATADAALSVLITATLGGALQTATLAVTATPRLTLTLDRSSVPGGGAATPTATVTLSAPAPAAGAVITLTSSSPAVAPVPASVTVAGASSSATFAVATSVVTSTTSATFTAAYAGRTAVATLTVVPDLPVAPSQLAASATGPSVIQLAWTDNSANEAGFEIERKTGSASFARIASVGANSTAYADANLSPNTAYLYRVRAVNASGASTYSNEASGVTPAVPPALRRVVAVFRPATREWFVRRSDGSVSVESFGGPGDQPVPADYLGTGESQLAVFRPATREWFIRSASGGTIAVPFGGPGDVPVPADYFGLRRAQIAVYRPATAEWFLRRDDSGTTREQFGTLGDVPVPADYFGLGRAQIAVYRPSTAEWFVRRDDGSALTVQWGAPGDVPVPGDYLGLGRAQIAAYRPSTGDWFVRSDLGQATRIPYGIEGDLPVPGDYTGIGRTQIAVFRPATREWFLRAPNGATTLIPWGGPGDLPVALERRDPVPPPSPLPAAQATYVIAGPTVVDMFHVDDDMTIELNGVVVFRDVSLTAGLIGPARFTAKPGDTIRIRAFDIGGCRWFDPLYLHRIDSSTGAVTTRLLTPGFPYNGNCSFSAGEYFDQTFTISF